MASASQKEFASVLGSEKDQVLISMSVLELELERALASRLVLALRSVSVSA
jgi:hypothetical protein